MKQAVLLFLGMSMLISGENISTLKKGRRYPEYPNKYFGAMKIGIGTILLGHSIVNTYDLRERFIEKSTIEYLHKYKGIPFNFPSKNGFIYRIVSIMVSFYSSFVLVYEGSLEMASVYSKSPEIPEAPPKVEEPQTFWSKYFGRRN